MQIEKQSRQVVPHIIPSRKGIISKTKQTFNSTSQSTQFGEKQMCSSTPVMANIHVSYVWHFNCPRKILHIF